MLLLTAVLTGSLPKLEPFPNHTLCNRTETNLPSSLVTSSAQNNSIHITGAGREEFLKRQSTNQIHHWTMEIHSNCHMFTTCE